MNVHSNEDKGTSFCYPYLLSNELKSASPVSVAKHQRGGSYGQYKTCSFRTDSKKITASENLNTGQTLPTNRQQETCMNCGKMEIELVRLKKTVDQFNLKQSSVEKHLKQYESLLKIKEDRLNEKESMLNDQMTFIQDEKHSMEAKKSIKAEKDFESNHCSKNPAKKTDLKNSRKSQSGDFRDQKNLQILELIKKKEKILQDKEIEIEEKFLKLIEVKQIFECKEAELKKKAQELCCDKEEIIKKEKFIAEETLKLKMSKQRLKNKLENLKAIEEKSLKLQELYENKLKLLDSSKALSESRISNELQKSNIEKMSEFNIEPLDELSFGKGVFAEIEKSIPEFYSPNSVDKKLLSELDNEIQNKSTYISRDSSENKSNLIEMIKVRFDQKSTEHHHQLRAKDLIHFQQIEKMQQEIEKLTATVKELSEENIKLKNTVKESSQKIDKIKRKKDSLKTEKGFDQLDETVKKLEDKLKVITLKEAEINDVNKKIKAEKETILNEAECLKILYLDFNRDKTEFQEEKEKFFYQKSAILDLERFNSERNQLMEIREKELAKLKSEVLSKEVKLQKIYSGIPRIGKRISTQKLNFNEA